MAVFLEPGELERIQADYRRTFIGEMAKNDIVRCAVEWYDFIDSTRGPIDAEGYAIKVVALSDAVQRWKEAQA